MHRSLFSIWKAGGVLLLALVATSNVQAYAGPGVGMELFGYFASLITWVLFAVGSLLLWPLYSLLTWLRGKRAKAGSAASEPVSVPEVAQSGDQGAP